MGSSCAKQLFVISVQCSLLPDTQSIVESCNAMKTLTELSVSGCNFCRNIIMGVHKKKCLEEIFSIIETTYNGYFFVTKVIDKVLSLSKFWRFLAHIKIVKITRLNGHISYKKQYLKIFFFKKMLLYMYQIFSSAKSSSFLWAFILHFYGVLFCGHPIHYTLYSAN